MDKEIKRRRKIGESIAKTNNLPCDIKSLYEISSRSMQKVLKRMWDKNLIKCSNCGYDKCTGDIHHINGRKIDDPHNHNNLSYLCPNCHRLAHLGILDKNKIINLNEHIGDEWQNHYYGYRTKKTKEEKIREEKEKAKIKQDKINTISIRKLLILSSNIDFSKFGYGVELGKLLNISPQKAKKWVEKHMPEFYENQCYKQK